MKVVYRNCNLLDGTKNMKVKENVDILVEDNKIAKIGKVEEADKVVDLKGQYVIPGLINLHVHLPASGKVEKKPKDSKKLVKLITEHKAFNFLGIMLTKGNALTELKSGVTTLRSVGGVADFDSKVRDMINSGKIEGPRIFASNEALTVEHGHMEGTVARAYKTNKQFLEGLKERKAQNVDWIKIMITGGVLDCTVKGEPGEMRMTPEQVKCVCAEAHKLGFKVAAHVESPEGVKVAIENGVDTIEHGATMSKEVIETFKKKKGTIVATLSPAVPLAVIPEEESFLTDFGRYNSYVVMKNIIESAKQALVNGIKLGLGTDTGCPFTTQYNFYRELVWATNLLKISPRDALHLATLNNAEILGEEKHIGSIEVGKYADMVVLKENPLDNLNTIANPVMVIKDGKQVKNIKIKKDKYVEDHLNKLMDTDFEDDIKTYLATH